MDCPSQIRQPNFILQVYLKAQRTWDFAGVSLGFYLGIGTANQVRG